MKSQTNRLESSERIDTNCYAAYTKRKQYTKALSLELVPVGKTRQSIEEQKLLEYDRSLYQMAEEVRPAIDELLREIIHRALSNFTFDFEPYYKNYQALRADGLEVSQRRSLLEEKNSLIRTITEATGKAIRMAMPGAMPIQKLNSSGFIFDQLPTLLKEYQIKDADSYIVKLTALKGCTPLFSRFIISRITILETLIPKRVIENLDIYIENMAAVRGIFASGMDLPAHLEDRLSGYDGIDEYRWFLSQEGIDIYNSVIAGEWSADGTKIVAGVNEYINNLNQTNRANKNYDGIWYRKLKPLNKQILTESQKMYFQEAIESDSQLKELLQQATQLSKYPILKALSLLSDPELLKRASIEGRNLHGLSHLLTGEHSLISNRLEERLLVSLQQMLEAAKTKKEKNEIEKKMDNPSPLIIKKSHSLKSIRECLGIDEATLHTLLTNHAQECYDRIQLAEIPESFYRENTKVKGNKKNTAYCKNWLDAVVSFRDYIKLFITQSENHILSEELTDVLNDLTPVTKNCYNQTRNYITKSMKESAKTMVCSFGTPIKMDTGTWYSGREKLQKKNNTIIRKDGKYYFLTLSRKSKPVRITETLEDTGVSMLLIKKGQPAFQQIPKILFKDAGAFFEANPKENVFVLKNFVSEPIVIPRKVYEIKKNKTFATPGKNATEEEIAKFREDLTLYLNLCRKFCMLYLDYASFNMEDLPDVSTYRNSGEFFSDIDTRLISMRWVPIKEEELDELVESGDGLLFLITNRNMYQEGRNKTSYARILLSILDEDHCKNPKMRLNARATITYREPLIETTVTHKKGSIVVNRYDKDGNRIPDPIHTELYHFYNGRMTVAELSEEAYQRWVKPEKALFHETSNDLIRNRRYGSEKFLVQLTYNINNEVAADTSRSLNAEIETDLVQGKNVLTLSRGTQDLLYYTLSDDKGNVFEYGDLNSVNGVNYLQLLKSKFKEGLEAKQNWDYSKNSKAIKEAYLKNIVAKVTKMALANHAIIVVEHISSAVRAKYLYLDNQIFNRFEEMLNQKLMNVSLKNIPTGDPGSYDNPIQISLDTKALQKGLLYQISGAYSRSRCPQTGFIPRFQLRNYKTLKAKRNFLSAFDSIRFCPDRKAFLFSFRYSDFGIQPKKEDADALWTVMACGPRSRFDSSKNHWEHLEDVGSEYQQRLKAMIPDFKEELTPLIPHLTSAALSELFELFTLAVSGKVQGAEEKWGYISPITGKYYPDISFVMCQNLFHSFMVRNQ